MKKIIAPSILSANFTYMEQAVDTIVHSGAQWMHIDVMDGHFVEPITFGAQMVRSLYDYATQKAYEIVFDTHLMVSNPERHIASMVEAGSNYITIHIESLVHAHRYITRIQSYGCKAGIALVPSTPMSAIIELLDVVDLVLVMGVSPGYANQSLILQTVQKAAVIAQVRDEYNLSFLLSFDGAVSLENAYRFHDASVDVLISGSSFFTAEDKREFVAQLMKA